jgi:hypothetical protein
MKKESAKKISLVIIGVLFSLFLLEITLRFSLFTKEQRNLGASELWRSHHNNYFQSIYLSSGCSFMDALTPHPYLAFVFHNNAPCGLPELNRVGIFQVREFPHERDPNFYSILVLGGSVANQIVAGARNYIWLEDILNEKFTSPNGKPFRVYSGAIGSWGIPNQLTMLNLYSHVIDAVIALDGHNEASKITVDAPDLVLYSYLTKSRISYFTPMALDFLRWFRRFFLTHNILSHFYLPYSFFHFTSTALYNYEHKSPSPLAIDLLRYTAMPEDWSPEKRERANRDRYLSYIQTLAGSAKALGINYAHFVQPIKAMGKTLSPEESRYVDLVDPEKYKKIILSASAEASKKGLYSFSLVDVFLPYTESLYIDHVHCRIEGGKSKGYAILSEAIAEKVAMAWRLKKKR